MRVAFVHSFYSNSSPSGENAVVEAQASAFADAGHEVILVSRSTDATKTRVARFYLSTMLSVSSGIGANPLSELRAFGPDVVHVHNLFPNYGTTWLRRWPGLKVVTLHNYRSICANGLLFRDGATCFDCLDGSKGNSILHGCYRGSRALTLPVALGLTRRSQQVFANVSAVILPSRVAADMADLYLPEALPRIVIPNFVDPMPRNHEPRPSPNSTPERGWIAAGRLSAEKGFRSLVEMWPLSKKLTIVGDGPEQDQIRRLAQGKRIDFLGRLENQHLRRLLPTFDGLVFPSECLEVAPTIVSEALGSGLPICSSTKSLYTNTLVRWGVGLPFSDSASLLESLDALEKDRLLFSSKSLQTFEEHFTKERWVVEHERLYESLIRM